MPSFKPNYERKVISVPANATTLDKKHKEFLSEFNIDRSEYIPQLETEINRLVHEKRRFAKPVSRSTADMDVDGDQTDLVQSARELEEQIKTAKKKIAKLKNKKKDYFLDNAHYIFEYFETKKNIDVQTTGGSGCSGVGGGGSDPCASLDPEATKVSVKNKLVRSFFNIKPPAETLDDDLSARTSTTPGYVGKFPSYVAVNESKGNSLYEKYLRNIDNNYCDISLFSRSAHLCQSCGHGEFIPMEDEGLLICNNCSSICQYLIENEKPSYKEPPKEITFYAYRKINHFKEILAQFQGKETTQIPGAVFDNLKLQITKERIQERTLTYQQIKMLLKKLGYNKYYEHINYIKNKLGIKPMTISQDLEETLCNLFMETQYPYAKHCPDYRINFLHYYYVLYKLFELLGEKQYLPEIPMLKDKDKLLEQDDIWKKICRELDWIFFPTV